MSVAGTRLYVVDDHAVVRQGLCALLAEAGCVIVGDSGDASRALADIETMQPDVALVDLHLGSSSGLQLLGELSQRAPAVLALVLSMSALTWHVGSALRAGARGYVLKGSPSQELLDAIAALRRGERFLGSGVHEPANGPRAMTEKEAIASLSSREQQVVVMVVNGASSVEIASALGLSPKTVETYRSRLMAKLGVSDITGLVKLAMRSGLIDWGGS